MKNLIIAFRLTIVMCIFLMVGYVLILWGFGTVVGPGGGNAETVEVDGKVVGAATLVSRLPKTAIFGDVHRVRERVMMQPIPVVVIRGLPTLSILLR